MYTKITVIPASVKNLIFMYNNFKFESPVTDAPLLMLFAKTPKIACDKISTPLLLGTQKITKDSS